MINWIKTAQGAAAIVAAIFATMVTWWNLGLVFSLELAPVHRRIEALERLTATPGCWCPTRPGGAPTRSTCSGRRWVRRL